MPAKVGPKVKRRGRRKIGRKKRMMRKRMKGKH